MENERNKSVEVEVEVDIKTKQLNNSKTQRINDSTNKQQMRLGDKLG